MNERTRRTGRGCLTIMLYVGIAVATYALVSYWAATRAAKQWRRPMDNFDRPAAVAP